MEELITFDKTVVGEVWGSHDWPVTQELCDAWQKLLSDETPAYTADGRRAMPQGLLLVMYANCSVALRPNRPSGGVHAKQKLRFGVPAYVGDVLTTQVKVADKYLKRERRYVELETITTNQHGEMVVAGVRTTIMSA